MTEYKYSSQEQRNGYIAARLAALEQEHYGYALLIEAGGNYQLIPVIQQLEANMKTFTDALTTTTGVANASE